MHRRAFLGTLAAAPLLAAPRPQQIIDTHTHFYDPSRPAGVPWPGKGEKILYRTVLPKEFAAMARPFGVTGTVVVEASPWLEDNQWVLDLAADNPIIVGLIGHLSPGEPEFRNHLERFSKNKLFRGIRLGENAFLEGLGKPAFLDDMKRMAGHGQTLDLNVGVPALPAIGTLATALPDLPIVIDHLPYAPLPDDRTVAAYNEGLSRLKPYPRVFAKVSWVLRRVNGVTSTNPATYRPSLETLWTTFGEDRLVYGSNWPVSDLVAPYGDVHKVVREFFAGKGQQATEKYFWRNSITAYNWIPRGAAHR